MTEPTYSTGRRAAAWGVHLYTAMGLPLNLLGAWALMEHDARTFFLAQLAAIDTTALTSASVRVAQEVITAWAAPGGPTAESWSGVRGLAALLESAGMSSEAQNTITIGAEPKMGFIKGRVGDDFVVPCIDFIITATTASGQPQQVAAADCQRMVWQDGRWVIGEGEEPAPAPSLWPGSQASFDAGYQWLEVPQS